MNLEEETLLYETIQFEGSSSKHAKVLRCLVSALCELALVRHEAKYWMATHDKLIKNMKDILSI